MAKVIREIYEHTLETCEGDGAVFAQDLPVVEQGIAFVRVPMCVWCQCDFRLVHREVVEKNVGSGSSR